jgi:hypothetical protein
MSDPSPPTASVARWEAPWQAPQGLRPRRPHLAPRLDPLEQAVTAVLDLDVDSTPPRQLADEVVALFRQVDRLTAAALDRLARVDAHGVAASESGTTTASWLRHHTGLPSGASSDLVRAARVVRERLPATRQALRSGEVTAQHARTICRTVHLVDTHSRPEVAAQAAAAVEDVLLTVAKAVDAGSLTGFATRVRQVVDPQGALADAARAHDRRWLTTATTLDGMVSVDGLLDPESGSLVLTALSAASGRRGPDDRRGAPQRRADALVEVCQHALDSGAAPQQGGVRPHLLVTAPLAALTGSPDSPTSAVPEAAWTGPLTVAATRRIACDASVTRIVLDPDSLPLDVGRSTRTVPAHLRHALLVRDGGCVAEGCDRPPAWTEAHHVVHWAEGGATALDNLVLLCRAHHRTAHEGDWHFVQMGTRWRLVPPPGRTPAPSADAGADQ